MIEIHGSMKWLQALWQNHFQIPAENIIDREETQEDEETAVFIMWFVFQTINNLEG